MLQQLGARFKAALSSRAGRNGSSGPTSVPPSGDGPEGSAPGQDALTGLPSRAMFERELLAAAHRADLHGTHLVLLCIGVDAFELVNETYGRASGDAALKQLAQRLARFVRTGYALARLGGTEFVLLAPGALSHGHALAEELMRVLREPMQIGAQRVQPSCSIGLAAYPNHGASTLLMGYADLAMRAARDSGGGCYVEFDRQMGEDQRAQAELARDLRGAVERQELLLYYQPKVDALTLQVTAAEALVRWQHPRRGLICPDKFITLAERHGLIGLVGDWVIREATRQAAEWRKRGLCMRVAINVSGVQLRQDGFAQRLAEQLKSQGLQPGRFTCEITETVAMEDTQATQRALAQMANMGVHVSIDDFGTGHSSLALLRRLRAEELKIDRAFVTDLGHSADALAVAKAIVQMAHSLDMKVVAEGVETEQQRDCLLDLGCDELQGFLFAKPMPAKSLELWATSDQDSPLHAFRPSLFSDTNVAGI
ncbi:MAG: putative bifunctional diguanylate cyclase/phosphodiesterase [Rubrivivax sp.]